MKVLKRGAEAVMLESNYLGQEAIVKKRIEKEYRCKQLDEKIRIERTRQETGLLHNAKKEGVRTPSILKIDLKENSIIMEKVNGKRLKEAINEENAIEYCKKFGEKIALLHNAGIMHGDLTTSNVIVNKENKDFCILDFGLGFYSRKIEDKAVDLVNLKKTFNATHFKLQNAWKTLLEEYEKRAENGMEVLKQMQEVEKRIRYA